MRARAILRRGLVFTLLWWVLAQGQADSWDLGLISVALALSASLWLSPPGSDRFSITGLLSFAGFFLLQSAKASVQVAALALRPGSISRLPCWRCPSPFHPARRACCSSTP